MSHHNPPTTVDAALADGVLTLTLNRPDKLNAYTAQMGRELETDGIKELLYPNMAHPR